MSERQTLLWRFFLGITLVGVGFGLLRIVVILGNGVEMLGLLALVAAGASLFGGALCFVD